MDKIEGPALVKVALETPLMRGETEIAELALRKPKSGDLRGISIGKLGILEYDEVRTLLPRITIPPITGEEVDQIEVADMTELGGAISDFLFTARRRAEFLNG